MDKIKQSDNFPVFIDLLNSLSLWKKQNDDAGIIIQIMLSLFYFSFFVPPLRFALNPLISNTL